MTVAKAINNVFSKQSSGFDLHVYRIFTVVLNCQILNFAEKSLFTTVSISIFTGSKRIMVQVDLKFRDKLAEMIGGEMHNLCYQCGACVGDCPAARYSDDYNPRLIMLKTLLGLEDDLICENSIIWKCTNCFNCYERCPQQVKPIEVIIALKNMIGLRHLEPSIVDEILQSVRQSGRTVLVNETVIRRREELNLPPLKDLPVKELEILIHAEEDKE